MCLAIPSKVIKIQKGWAIAQSGKHKHRANLDLLKNVKVGDYIIIHKDLAINKIPKSEAEKILKMTNELNR